MRRIADEDPGDDSEEARAPRRNRQKIIDDTPEDDRVWVMSCTCGLYFVNTEPTLMETDELYAPFIDTDSVLTYTRMRT